MVVVHVNGDGKSETRGKDWERGGGDERTVYTEVLKVKEFTGFVILRSGEKHVQTTFIFHGITGEQKVGIETTAIYVHVYMYYNGLSETRKYKRDEVRFSLNPYKLYWCCCRCESCVYKQKQGMILSLG